MHLTTRSSILLLIFVVLGTYYPAIFAPLNSIDDPDMYNYLLNTDSFTLQSIFTPAGNYYRPVLLLSYMMDKYVWGLEASFMHLENICFHLCNTLLVFAVARKAAQLQKLPSRLAPFAAALFFAIHPLNTEAVAWIAGRTDLLACFFILLAFLLLLRESSNFGKTILSALCLLIASLAKETAIFFLPAALILPFYITSSADNRTSWRVTCLDNLPHLFTFSLTGAAYFAFRTGAFTRSDAGVTQVFNHVGGGQSASLLLTLRLVFKAAGFYLKKLFLPFPLNFGIMHVSDLYLPVGIVLLFTGLWLLTRRTLLAFFFLSAAAIGSSALLIPLLKQTWTPLAERYMYIPLAFFLIGISFAIQRWEKRARYQPALTVLLFLLAGIAIYGSSSRTILWQNNLAFYQDVVKKTPDFVPGQNELAKALASDGRIKEANAIIQSLDIPADLLNRQFGEISKAAALINGDDLPGARLVLNRTLEHPGKHEVLILQWLLEVDKLQLMVKKVPLAALYPASVKNLSRLVVLTGDPFYSYRLGVLHLQVGERAKALAAFKTVMRTAPRNAYYRQPAEKLVKSL